MKSHTGIVYLVGAGPGDPGLLTLKGKACIERADVIVYDRLIPQGVLRWARPEAELIYVGKAASRHAMPQEQINRLLAARAKLGRTVCRLKGGDPFVFGRGGEEAAHLAAEGVPFEVVPGVTSAIAAPAYAGIPVTDRQCASVVSFVTGQEDAEKEQSTLRWDALAIGSDTLVFLMGRRNLPDIVANLLAGGRPASTPVALVERGTTPTQRTTVGTLADIVERAEAGNVRSPVAIIVGEVVKLRRELSWFERRPLFGLRIMVTRSREQASELTERLEALGALVIEFPVIETAPLPPDPAIPRGLRAGYDWIIFTSVNGVRSLVGQLRQIGLDLRALGSARLGAIGPGTARALEGCGLKVDFVPTQFTGEGVAAEFPEDPSDLRILIPRAKEAPDLLPESLRARGALVDVVPVYETMIDESAAEAARERLRAGEVDMVTFTSSSTVRNFLNLAGDAVPDGLQVASIGPVTSQTARQLGLRVDVEAEQHTIPGLVEAVVSYWRERALERGAPREE